METAKKSARRQRGVVVGVVEASVVLKARAAKV
jgi:hypothetical protein